MSDTDIETKRVTRADLKAGVTLAIGRTLRIVVDDQVDVRIEWPADVVDRLPDDFKLTLSGPEVPKQELQKSAATPSDGDMMRFTFTWEGPAKIVTLEASGNGETVVLWRDHAAADLRAPLQWNERLDPLLDEHEDVEIAGAETRANYFSSDPKPVDFDALLLAVRA